MSLLFSRNNEFQGSGERKTQPFVLLHGLFGSSKNWISISRYLSQFSDVYALDLRNHGESFHDDEHTIPKMAEDVVFFLDHFNLKSINLIGHSMGGLVAMYLALKNPHWIDRLVIEDIAPRSYPFVYQNEIQAFHIDVSNLNSRNEVDQAMEHILPDPFLRQFLQMNLQRKDQGGYEWKINWRALESSERMFENYFPRGKISNVYSLFLLGGDSDYVTKEDEQIIQDFFPNALLSRLTGAGHFLHYTHSETFLSQLTAFLFQKS